MRRGEPRVAFVAARLRRPLARAARPRTRRPGRRARVLDHLTRRGAAFATDLARELGLEPSRTRAALDELLRRGLATNDRFDPLRPGAEADGRGAGRGLGLGLGDGPPLGLGRPSLRRPASSRPEGRWSRLAPAASDADAEAAHLAWAAALLDRYGVLTRETVALDPWAPPWRDLAPWLARAELRGELRRGYFVEGLSGVQYASGRGRRRAGPAGRRPSRPTGTLS